MTTPFTREQFNRQRARAQATSASLGRLTAIVAVVLGGAQLLFIRQFETRMPESKRLPFELAFFGAYIVVVAFLIWRMDREVSAARPRCPHCKVSLKGNALDVAGATGHCPSCGQPLWTPEAPPA